MVKLKASIRSEYQISQQGCIQLVDKYFSIVTVCRLSAEIESLRNAFKSLVNDFISVLFDKFLLEMFLPEMLLLEMLFSLMVL